MDYFFDPDIHHRHSIRKPYADYSEDGYLYITICTHRKIHLFGYIHNDTMCLNEVGKMVDKWYHKIEEKFEGVICSDYIIMPNHIHFIIHKDNGILLRNVVSWFKTMTTNEYFRNVRNGLWQPVEERLWQRNYYEHIIRNSQELMHITAYIQSNPSNWATDEDA